MRVKNYLATFSKEVINNPTANSADKKPKNISPSTSSKEMKSKIWPVMVILHTTTAAKAPIRFNTFTFIFICFSYSVNINKKIDI